MPENTFIAISGGFDPLHAGHIKYIDDASLFGKVIVLLNSDEWLIRKKGYALMPFFERKTILESLRNVYGVIQAFDDDGTVCESLRNLSKTVAYFGNGGDRVSKNTPEIGLCERLGIVPLFGLGGQKIQSSSELVKNVQGQS